MRTRHGPVSKLTVHAEHGAAPRIAASTASDAVAVERRRGSRPPSLS